ncbi:MAG: aldo/keto reductase, partial [Verrucomicrobia bacterium]|nr:aldo/keto reductase [Verrucomicrobiota bacterium]
MTKSNWTRREFIRTGATAAAGIAVFPAIPTVYAGNPTNAQTSGILNYNEQMEYRRAGKTGLMVSAVCLGGHWKRLNKIIPGLYRGGSWLSADLTSKEFEKNRYDVVTRCIERGINYIDACTKQEVIMYAKALKGRRGRMYLGFSWYQEEMRHLAREIAKAKKAGKPKPPGWITEQLKAALDHGFKTAGLDYVDIWRVTLFERSSMHPDDQMEEMLEALDWAKRTGRARFVGFSSHDRPHIKKWIEKASDRIDAVCTPYTARTRLTGARIERAEEGNSTRVVTLGDKTWENSLWAAMQKHDIAWFGIKPFSSGSIFKGDGAPGNPHEKEDNRIARLTIRAILT